MDNKINIYHKNKRDHNALVTTIVHNNEYTLMNILPLLKYIINQKNKQNLTPIFYACH